MAIGILSSIDFHPKMRDAFSAGFGAALPALTVADDVGFKPADLDHAIGVLLAAGVGMIATFGGVTASKRMKASNSLPFVSVVGSSYDLNLSNLFRGYVDLDDIKEDAGRVTWLANHVNNAVGGSGGNIGLYYNANTPWGPDEAMHFTGASKIAASLATHANPSAGNFFNDLNSFPAGTRAIVLSAAGFFHRRRDALITAANNYGAYMCYPLMGYRNVGGVQPTSGNAVIYGVDLDGRHGSAVNSAYYIAGVMAAAVWNGGACDGTPNPQIQTAHRVVHPL
jgi:hypothetical protein